MMYEYQIKGFTLSELQKPKEEQEPIFNETFFAITSSTALRRAEEEAGLQGVSSNVACYNIIMKTKLPNGGIK